MDVSTSSLFEFAFLPTRYGCRATSKDAELISTSDYCKVQMFCINNHILGIQAHPEMLKVHNHALIKEYQDDIKSEFQHALESLRIRDNSLIMAHWMANFFEYKD